MSKISNRAYHRISTSLIFRSQFFVFCRKESETLPLFGYFCFRYWNFFVIWFLEFEHFTNALSLCTILILLCLAQHYAILILYFSTMRTG